MRLLGTYTGWICGVVVPLLLWGGGPVCAGDAGTVVALARTENPTQSTVPGIAARHVLILNSYHLGYRWSDDQLAGIVAALQGCCPTENIHIEYLDTKRHFSDEYLADQSGLLRRKYAAQRFDVIVATDDRAFELARAEQKSLFQGTPIVFAGVSQFSDEDRKGDAITGVIEVIDAQATVDLALKLCPGTRDLYVILETSETTAAWRPFLDRATRDRGFDVHWLEGKDLTTEELLERVKQLTSQSTVIAGVWNRDRTGRFVSVDDISHAVCSGSSAPVFALDRTWVANGAVGGRIAMGHPHGFAAGVLAAQILAGTPAQQIPIHRESTSPYILNYNQLRHLGIDLTDVPAGSTLLYLPPPSFYSENKLLILSVVLIIVVLLTLVIGLAANVLQRHRIEKRLRQSEERYRVLFETDRDAVVITRPGGSFVTGNPAALTMFGYDKSEFTRLTPALVSPAVQPDGITSADKAAEMLRLAGERETHAFEWVHRRRNGESFPAEVRLTRMELGGEVLLQATVRDITERKQFEERLRQSEKLEAIGQLAGGVAHDFNNQLAAIMGFAELLERKLDQLELQNYLANILKSCRRAADLTKGLLAFARKGMYQSIPVSIHNAVAEVVQLIERSMDRRVTIEQDLQAQPDTVLGDASQLQNALLNLALNARDAMPQGGRLIFRTTTVTLDRQDGPDHLHELPPGQYLCLSVTDTGTGIDEEVRRHLFEPFFTTKEAGKGTGMGLASVYGIVNNHNGVIDVRTEVDKGTTFSLYLPLARCDPPEPSSPDLPEDTRTGRILVVDDEDTARNALVSLLQSVGHDVVACRDGVEAIERYREMGDGIDLVILDMVMPRMGGADTFLALREINPEVNVLLASGYSLDGEAQKILDQGARGFIQKPFQWAELSRKLGALL